MSESLQKDGSTVSPSMKQKNSGSIFQVQVIFQRQRLKYHESPLDVIHFIWLINGTILEPACFQSVKKLKKEIEFHFNIRKFRLYYYDDDQQVF